MSHSGITRLADELTLQRDFFAPRVPVYARLLELLPDVLTGPRAAALASAWSQRTFSAWYERPLLLLGAMRDDALREGNGHPLWQAIAAAEPEVRCATPAALATALSPDRRAVWLTLEARFVQTNETSRALAWLWPAALAARSDPARPIVLADIGASAGLNLVADHLPAIWEQPDGAAVPVTPLPPIIGRTGFDSRPVDARDDDQARWLRACVWPGQRSRIERLEAAIGAFRRLARGGAGPAVLTCAAREVAARLPRPPHTGGPRVIAYQTVVRDYMQADDLRAYERGMDGWLQECPPASALWMELEVARESADATDPFHLTAHLRLASGEVVALVLASSEPHPHLVRVRPDAVETLRRALG
jgi:hypothetical protein